ncbi:MAG: hypothetical protein BGN85_08530 [Alphaproteobacteria bacterium 64-11]|nr:hypothetical protein [Alphaproteobacteria bacterium]OJU09795.1 MAG: hypothetical protein BGN85_08530 [Alphaproteobacteria bacterium 64-11]
MRRPAVRIDRLAIPPLNRRLLALLALLAFFLQGLAVQTHIHPASLNLPTTVAAASGPSLPGPLTGPDLDQGSCRLCQEMAHAGAYLAPVAALLPAILVFALEPPAFELADRPAPAPAFAWQIRGPPGR